VKGSPDKFIISQPIAAAEAVEIMPEEIEKVEPEILDPEEEEEEEFDFYHVLRDFFSAYKEEIGSIIKAFGKNIEEGPKMKLRAMIATFLMLAFIISILAFLTYEEILSGEALAFLCGTIIGYLFSFLRTSMVGVSN
jgi:hypothetical protein